MTGTTHWRPNALYEIRSEACAAAAAQDEELAAARREADELRAALERERERATTAAAEAATNREASDAATARAAASEEAKDAAVARAAAARTLLAQQVSKELKSLGTITSHLAPRWELYLREGSRAIPIVSFRGPGLNVERKPSTCHSMHILLPLMLHLSRLISYTQYSVQVYYFI